VLDIAHPPLTELPANSANGRARAAALNAIAEAHLGTAGFVDYQSNGCVLITGPAERALAAARVLSDTMRCLIIADDQATAADLEHYLLARGRPSLTGYLGAFNAELETDQGNVNAASLASGSLSAFDLVIDVSDQPLIGVEKPPLGYQRPGADAHALAAALNSAPDMVGAFQKPKFFAYNENICAHGARGMSGCNRCLDACATGAIISLGETIEVDPYLCQGCGSCATACPSGAISYAYPQARDLLGALRRALKAYAPLGEESPAVLFHDDEWGAETLSAIGDQLPERLVPFAVEDTGSIGPDIWLTVLAMGASDVLILQPDAVEPAVQHTTQTQHALFSPVLEALQLTPQCITLLDGHAGLMQWLSAPQLHPGHGRKTRQFSIAGGKRERLQVAFTELYRPSRDQSVTALPEGAPFGRIHVDREACTLCMACAAVCPAEAINSGGGEPRLLFTESNCLQCGLCEQACPEDAITLEARLNLPAMIDPAPEVVNEEVPFACVSCGKAFATEKMIRRVLDQLAGHWMFTDERAKRRLEMCEDCRVKDLFDDENTAGQR
jgi:ferredoxin